MNNEIVAGIMQKVHGINGCEEKFLALLDPKEKEYLQKIRDEALRKMEETFKSVRHSSDILLEKGKISPKLISEPLNSSGIENLPDIQRKNIPNSKK